MGSGRERFVVSMADWNSFPALGDDAGKAWDAEDLERLADLLHVHAFHSGNVPDAERRCELRARVCTVLDRRLVPLVPGLHLCRLSLLLRSQSRSSAK